MERRTICVAGHVDHGKTALVGALTGHDTDRLPEEKRRGLSIEPGFAPLDMPGSPSVSLVDLPGHERFVRHMVAGASGVDAYLLCVACDDAVMPQTREHLMVLRALDISTGVIALTKIDRADPATAAAQVRDLVGPDVEAVPVCARDGRGLGRLREALATLARTSPRRMHHGPSRLFVDRAFSVPGAGTVVSGTLWGAAVKDGDDVVVSPGDAVGRVRGLEVHGSSVPAVAGGRVAMNLARISVDEVTRGSCLMARSAPIPGVDRIDAVIAWEPGSQAALRSRRRLQLFLGTAEVAARCLLPKGEVVRAGESGVVNLRLERALPIRTGDRFVLRDAGPRTVGGGIVRNVSLPPQATMNDMVSSRKMPTTPAALAGRGGSALSDSGPAGLTAAGMERILGINSGEADILLRGLVDDGAAVHIGKGRVVDVAFIEAATGVVRATLSPDGITLRALADLWGVGRETARELAEYMDREGVTRRNGDQRYLNDSSSDATAEPPGAA